MNDCLPQLQRHSVECFEMRNCAGKSGLVLQSSVLFNSKKPSAIRQVTTLQRICQQNFTLIKIQHLTMESQPTRNGDYGTNGISLSQGLPVFPQEAPLDLDNVSVHKIDFFFHVQFS